MILREITPGNTIYVLSSGGKSHSIWLSPDLVNFAQRVSIHVRGTEKFHKTVHPSIEAILEDYRLCGPPDALHGESIN